MKQLLDWYMWLASWPYLSFGVVWLTTYMITGRMRKAVFASMDITFFILLGSVFKLLEKLTETPWTGWLMLFGLLMAFGVIGRRQEAKRGGFNLVRVVRYVARTGFILLGVLYLVLLIVYALV